jgi:hypothetical protein
VYRAFDPDGVPARRLQPLENGDEPQVAALLHFDLRLATVITGGLRRALVIEWRRLTDVHRTPRTTANGRHDQRHRQRAKGDHGS